MLLKEIELDLPYIVEDVKQSKESIRTYEATWKQKRVQFRLSTRCITSMIERLMSSIKTEDCKKILIECVEKSPKEETIVFLGVCSVQIHVDLDVFWGMNDYDKKRLVVSIVLEAIESLEMNRGYDLTEIKRVCSIIRQKDYMNVWFWNKTVRRNKKLAQIRVTHDVDKVSLHLVISNSNGEVLDETLLIQELPDEWAYNRYLGKLIWTSDQEIQLITKDGEVLVTNIK